MAASPPACRDGDTGFWLGSSDLHTQQSQASDPGHLPEFAPFLLGGSSVTEALQRLGMGPCGPCVLTHSLGPNRGPGSGLQVGGQVLAGAYGPRWREMGSL